MGRGGMPSKGQKSGHRPSKTAGRNRRKSGIDLGRPRMNRDVDVRSEMFPAKMECQNTPGATSDPRCPSDTPVRSVSEGQPESEVAGWCRNCPSDFDHKPVLWTPTRSQNCASGPLEIFPATVCFPRRDLVIIHRTPPSHARGGSESARSELIFLPRCTTMRQKSPFAPAQKNCFRGR